MRSSTRVWRHVVHGRLGGFALMLALVLASTGLGATVEPLAMRWLVDVGLARRELGAFAAALGCIVVAGVLVRVLGYVSEIVRARVTNQRTEALTSEVLRALYRVPYAQLEAKGHGYYVSRVYEEPARLVRTGTVTMLALAGNLLSAIVSLGLAAYLSWRITAVLLVVAPPLVALSRRFARRLQRQAALEHESEGLLRQTLKRAIASYRTVNVFGLMAPTVAAVAGALSSYLGDLFRRTETAARFGALSGVVSSVTEAIVLGAAAHQVFVGGLTVGGLFAYMTVFWRAMQSATGVLKNVADVATLAATADRVDELLAVPRAALPAPAAGIRLEGFDFAYDGRPVFRELSLAIEPGRRVLLAGPNGSGKTTLAHVLAGFLHGAAGRLDGCDPARTSAMLTPLEFAPCTLGDHLRLHDRPAAERDGLLALLRDLGLADRVDDDPATFSEGLKRKAYAAIALSKDAETYLFDEPLAGVDDASKPRVMAQIETRTRGKTVIAILHGDREHCGAFDQVITLPAAPDPDGGPAAVAPVPA